MAITRIKQVADGVVRGAVLVMIGAVILGCSAKETPPPLPAVNGTSNGANRFSAPEVTMSAENVANAATEKPATGASLVDERFELLSLVFRLAGRQEYGDADTAYQKELASTFAAHKTHPAVQYAAILSLGLGYDAVFKYAVHLVKKDGQFALIEDIDSLVKDGRWTRKSAVAFLSLLNAFYKETDFAAFYQSQIPFYETETERFVEKTWSKIDLEWFRTYVDPANLRCVYAPSSTRNNYGATVNDTIVYGAVSNDGSSLIHEFCHSFANPIAHKWYDENKTFRKWCDETINPQRLPTYSSGKIIAGEYVTRAYNILYLYETERYPPWLLFRTEKAVGFPYIEDVYAMITPYEKPAASDDKIKDILGVSYTMGPEKSFTANGRTFRWKVLSLSKPLPWSPRDSKEVGNVYRSQTGDVLYVEAASDGGPALLFDLGETTFRGASGYRRYYRVLME